MPETLLEVKDLECPRPKGEPIFSHINFSVREGDILIVQGKSGSGCVRIASHCPLTAFADVLQ